MEVDGLEVYDLIVLGGGPAGYRAAERAAQGGLGTVLFEKRALGGVCLNEGCIPSKAFLSASKIADSVRHGEGYGVRAEGVALDHGAVRERKNRVVKTLVSGIETKLKALGVSVVGAEARILGKENGLFSVASGGALYSGKTLLIATGSLPLLPPIPGLEEAVNTGFALTNRELLDIPAIPPRLAVIGGGVIGLEMACYFAEAGSAVTVIEMLGQIAGSTESEIAGILLKNLKKKGIAFHLNSRATSIENGGAVFSENGKEGFAEADALLVSVGRKANTEGFGLETLGVHTERGAIVTDEYMRTSIPGVYAAGDVNGKSMLAHTAYREAEVAVSHMLGIRDAMRYDAVPSVIYTHPEAAGAGETEESAKAKGYQVKSTRLSLRYSGRYMAETDDGDGIIKLVADGKTNRLLGVHMIGSYASEMIYGASMMIDAELDMERIRRFVFPHPTVCEIIKEALFTLE